MVGTEVRSLFQCPRCGFGSHEVGHLVMDDEDCCIVCQEEVGIQVRLLRWDEAEGDQARLREPPLAA